MSSVSGAAQGIAAGGGSPETQAAAPHPPPLPPPAPPAPHPATGSRAGQPRAGVSGLFARSILDYARQHHGEPVRILQAGCTGPAEDIGLGESRPAWLDVSVRSIDTEEGAGAELAAAGPLALGDPRAIPLPPRGFSIVCAVHLLDRVEHAELVLDRLVAALRPGGLLLLRFRDRQCAAGLLDRILPTPARRAIWHWLRPRQAGPFPAVFGRLLSTGGMHAYTLARGLVIAEREAVRDRPRRPARPAWGAPLACRLIAAATRGRLPDDHDDLLYVIRKPENRFARVL
jgi:SAM-dependent methyltransferase